jgi:hypothetical protein
MKPELLAVRAINQYRRRDVLAYIGLRYYLKNSCTLTDFWARDISTHLVSTRGYPIYFRSPHFKEISEGEVVHRNIFVPGPNEILAETALLYECSKYPAFRSSSDVYSYHFPSPKSKAGVFKTYFPGFKSRHNSIADACRNMDDAKVRYTDIRKFYPNIPSEVAIAEWESVCSLSNISTTYRDLGEDLLRNHRETAIAQNEGQCLLIGPMFSHLIANIILAKVDKAISNKMGGKYWRYVDDIVLVGDVNQVNSGRELLSSMLSDIGLVLHDDGKDFEVDSNEWLEGAHDFDGSEGVLWSRLVADIKRFLIARPEQRNDLVRAFSENGINIPLLDYSAAVLESSYLNKLSDWLIRNTWSLSSVKSLTVRKFVEVAIRARRLYTKKINELLDQNSEIKGYARKRLVTKLRFYAGRLLFLATPEILTSLSSATDDYPELILHSRALGTIQSRDVTHLLELGTNAVQAAAQILRINNSSVKCSLSSFREVELQGIAILRLNGINIDFTEYEISETTKDPLNQFALGINPIELMKSDDPFIREISCLRGIEEPLRHEWLLNTAFDRDEQLIFDIINQLHQSSYFN